jgi:gamma-glutamyl-gamma-aminobutyrate hydrolase PuuD
LRGQKYEDFSLKILALTQRVELVQAYREKRDCLDQRWTDFVLRCGFIPVPLPNNLSAVRQLAGEVNISGFVLTGGNSLAKYGGDAQERDEVERFLIGFAMQKDLPLVGVCRGMQVIQDYFGVGLERIEGHVAVNHKLLMGKEEVLKNSYHSLGSRKSAEELLVEARAEDGVIEAVRHSSKKIYGMMWHPERNSPFEKSDVALFHVFFGK